MDLSLGILVGWAIMGWCGTVPRPRPPIPPTPPDPDPWGPYLISSVVAAIGGLIGGFVFVQLFNADHAADATAVLSLLGALAGGRIISGLGARMMPGR